MATPVHQYHQSPDESLVPRPVSVRDSMSAGELLSEGAKRLLDVGDYTRSQRQRLHDLSRPCRIAAADRSGLATWLELAPFATPGAGLWLLELGRVEVIGRSRWTYGNPDDAHEAEARANMMGDITALRLRERRTRSALLDFTDAMLEQKWTSEAVANAEAAEMRVRSAVVVSRR